MKTRSIVAAIAALSLSLGLTACGGDSGTDEPTSAASIPAEGLDDGTELTMWTRAPLERQAKNAVDAYNASHKNQVKLEILPNDDVEGKVGGAIQTDTLPDILAGDVVRIPYWVQQGVFTDVISVDLRATLPISVASPTAVTTMRPLPFITIVERRAMLEG